MWKAQRGRERPCDANVAFRFGAVITHLRTHYTGVAHRVLDILMAVISLQGSGVMLLLASA